MMNDQEVADETQQGSHPSSVAALIVFALSSLAAPVSSASWNTGGTSSQSKLASIKEEAISKEAESLSSDPIVSQTINNIQPEVNGFTLQHPYHRAIFTSNGLEFSPTRSQLSWTWHLSAVKAGIVPLPGVNTGSVRPEQISPLAVSYARGGLVEQYLAREATLEQQFLISQKLPLDGADLVIEGEIQCQGRFEPIEDGWTWTLGDQSVRLGNVRAFDASGEDIPVSMQVSSSETRITVDGKALAFASYPVTIDPEVGLNDFRISYMGRDTTFDALNPAVAYNSTDNEFLVVWHADDDDNFLADDEYEIYAQRVSADTWALVGSMISVSNMGTNGYENLDAYNPDVAYNSTNNQYLVVWEADMSTGGLVNDEYEIYGQLLTAAGAETGPDDARLSDLGGVGNAAYDAIRPSVAYNSTENEYLVVWQGDDGPPLADDENEIYGQLLTSGLAGTHDNDFRISDMGPDGDAEYDGYNPSVAYNREENEYLVVWSGSDDETGMAAGESEVYGQMLEADGTGKVGTPNDFRLSEMGGLGDASYRPYAPDVVFNSTDNEFLVVWYSDDDSGALVDEEYEIYGQRLNIYGGGEGTNDFRISDMGPVGSIAYRAEYPSVTYNSQDNQYLVVWQGVDDTPPLVAGEQEIFGQLLYASGAGVPGANDFRISHMGPDGNTPYWAYGPVTAYNSLDSEFLVSWYGDDDDIPLINDEYEIFAAWLTEEGEYIGGLGRRISYMEPLGNATYKAYDPAVASDNTLGSFLTVWSGNTNAPDSGFEIFGRKFKEFQISTTGPDGTYTQGAFDPAVAHNSDNNQYLVVWQSDQANNEEYEIYGQLVDSPGDLIGGNFRISDMGPNGSTLYGAYNPDVIYNSVSNQYLVVWAGDDNTAPLLDNEYEIYGQLLESDGDGTGSNDFRISDMGGVGNTTYGAGEPAVAYNPDLNQYLVVWQGDDDTSTLADNELEIFGQLLEADGSDAEGTPIDFRISDMGGTGNAVYNAYSPDAVYNEVANQYLVVWYGDDNTSPLVDEEYEIYGQRMTTTAVGAGPNDFRISDMGPDGDEAYDAYNPAIEYSSDWNRYLVVWYGDDGLPLANDEDEIYTQLLSETGASIGWNDFRVSDMGADGDYQYNAITPAVSRYPGFMTEFFIVVWAGDDNTFPLVNEEFEIFGQALDAIIPLYLPFVVQ